MADYVAPPKRFTLGKNAEPTAENVGLAVEESQAREDRYDSLEEYYLGDQDILDRQSESDTAKNNQLVNNFASYIADISSDYLLGNPVDYVAPDDLNIDPIRKEYTKQSIADLDSDLSLGASIFGLAYELVFIDEDGNVVSTELDPRHTLMVYDDTVQHRELWAIHYLTQKDPAGEEYTELTIYTASEIIVGTLSGESFAEESRTPHFFGRVPVIEYLNNKHHTGDFEGVISLIDAYNILQSDRVNEREQMADAILCLRNFTLNKENTARLRDDRLLTNIPADGDAFYLTKSLNETDADVLKKSVADDIHKFSKTPNLSDENFVGNSSGVALRYKLLAFEEKTKTKERHFERSLKKRLAIYWNGLKNTSKMPAKDLDLTEVDVVFNRNLPTNDLEMSQIVSNLKGIVKDEYLVKQLSFIDNAEKALVETEPDETPESYPDVDDETIEEDIENKLSADLEGDAEDEEAPAEE